MKKKIIIILIICFLLSITLAQGATFNQDKIAKYNSNQSEAKTTSSAPDWWPMFQHDLRNTGFSQSNGPDTNEIAWTFNAKSNVQSPVINDEKVFFGTSNSSVYCLSITGQILWKSIATGEIDSSPAVYNGKLFIGNTYGKIFCFDENNGDLLWDLQLNGAVSSPLVVEEGLIIECLDGHVYCIDQNSGTISWQTQLGIAVLSTPIVVENKIFVRNHCLDLKSGTIIWSSDVGIVLSSSPTFFENKIYICSRDEKMYCLDADTGKKLWRFYTGSVIYANAPAIAYGNVYVGNAFGFIYCVNATTGEYVWSTKESARAVSSPAICDEKMYIGSVDNSLYCLDAFTGENIWQFTSNDDFLSSSAIADNHLFSVSGNILFCFGDEYSINSDLDCTGSFSFNDVKPGSVITSEIIISNIGNIGSTLDWKISSYPDWGSWSFEPRSGSNLLPNDESTIIEVKITVPSEKDASFSGNIIVVNNDDSSDYETLEVSLVTSIKNKSNNYYELLLNRIFDMLKFFQK